MVYGTSERKEVHAVTAALYAKPSPGVPFIDAHVPVAFSATVHDAVSSGA